MNRRNFLKDGCLACLGIVTAGSFLSACKTMQQTTGELTHDGMKIALEDFISKKGTAPEYHKYLVVRNDALQYPICVYRFSDTDYSALYMRCSHQGAELQAAGDRLSCPAHGSEFDNRGIVRQGPADQALRSFPVSISGNELMISLKKQS